MVKCWVKKKKCLPRDTQIFQLMFGRQCWCATGWFHFRNGQQNDSSRQSQKADLNLSAHFSNIVYDQMSCVLVRHLFIYSATSGGFQVFQTHMAQYFIRMSASWVLIRISYIRVTKFFWFSSIAVSSYFL